MAVTPINSAEWLRFDGYEVAPVVEFDPVRGSGATGVYCEPFESEAEAKEAAQNGRMFWTVYGRTEGEGVEAIGDFETQELALRFLYQISGIRGELGSGRTIHRLPKGGQ